MIDKSSRANKQHLFLKVRRWIPRWVLSFVPATSKIIDELSHINIFHDVNVGVAEIHTILSKIHRHSENTQKLTYTKEKADFDLSFVGLEVISQKIYV